MDGLPIRGLMWLIGLVTLNALVEAMVTAFENVSGGTVEKRSEEGDKKARLVQHLMNHHRRYITVTDLLRLLAVSGMAVVYYSEFLPCFKGFLKKSLGENTHGVLIGLLLVLITLGVVMLVELMRWANRA